SLGLRMSLQIADDGLNLCMRCICISRLQHAFIRLQYVTRILSLDNLLDTLKERLGNPDDNTWAEDCVMLARPKEVARKFVPEGQLPVRARLGAGLRARNFLIRHELA